MSYINTMIIGTGSHIPDVIVKNEDYINQDFYTEKLEKIKSSGEKIIRQFQAITGINERRHAEKGINTSDIAFFAAEEAIKDSGIDRETIDQIIVAQNFGDVEKGGTQSSQVPSIASRVKHSLKIKNPTCVAYDVVFGCPGWIQAFIQAHAYIQAGMGKRFLVIGAEALSRVSDKYDRDSMIFADGAGAVVIEAQENDEKKGFLSYSMQSDTLEEVNYLFSGKTYKLNSKKDTYYIKMQGRKIYEYALSKVPHAMKLALDRSAYVINDLKKIIIHQANEKMDEAMLIRFYKLFNLENDIPKNIMPMSIAKLGNSSVATIPTLYDFILKGKYEQHKINEGDIIMFASVGAGMNINSIIYKA